MCPNSVMACTGWGFVLSYLVQLGRKVFGPIRKPLNGFFIFIISSSSAPSLPPSLPLFFIPPNSVCASLPILILNSQSLHFRK